MAIKKKEISGYLSLNFKIKVHDINVYEIDIVIK